MATGLKMTRVVWIGGFLLAGWLIGCEWNSVAPDAGSKQRGLDRVSAAEPFDPPRAKRGIQSVDSPRTAAGSARMQQPAPATTEADEPISLAVKLAFVHADGEATDHLQKARSALEADDRAGAMLELEKALYDDPANYEAAFVLGKTAKASGQTEVAVDAFMLATQIDENRDEPWVELARVSLAQKQYAEAERLIRRALRLNPRRPLSHNVLGRIWLNRSHWDRAIVRFEKAHELSPDDAHYRNNLGLALLLKRDFPRAVEVLQPLSVQPAIPAYMHNNLGLAYEGQGQLQEAIAQFKRALEVNPRYVNAQLNLDRLVQLAQYSETKTAEDGESLELEEPEVVEGDLILPAEETLE